MHVDSMCPISGNFFLYAKKITEENMPKVYKFVSGL